MNVDVRPLVPDDKPAVMQILHSLPEFYPQEVVVAEELIDAYLESAERSGYHVAVAQSGNEILGYICFGPTPITQGTWDIYWIAVSPLSFSRGIGTMLLQYAENEIRDNRGRLILIETSSRTIYAKARKFYQRHNYKVICRIADFYATADDKIMYLKKI